MSDEAEPATSATRLRPPRHPVDRRAVGWWTTNLVLLVAAPVAVLDRPAGPAAEGSLAVLGPG
ncbi:hypothetical protein [Paractinoplanes lichenicola]|uniref:Uncharacterized protein n=1 Tax=Paractinoplanes lichenicola TaxID=2802976 RepID=A0ABS1VG53_9ACTN|nr:hypothetical protein [Actinoplanes lichenicola]MBL7253139.1 hypothetical protein [Actinoplanes lichenicola]